jgi:hypothetical protein
MIVFIWGIFNAFIFKGGAIMEIIIRKRPSRFVEGINIIAKENNTDRQGAMSGRQTIKVLKRALLVGIILISFCIAAPATAATDPLCGSTESISCSSYAVFGSVRDSIRKIYNDKFHAACAFHDYCYRYGYATYGRSKAQCDTIFLQHMQESCKWYDLTGEPITCGSAADAFYAAVAASPQAAKAFQKGTQKCQYEGFCPPGKFDTTGWLHNCKCAVGHKNYTGKLGGWFKESAYCTGSPCPRGRFSTTGEYRGCACPTGSKKEYLDPASAYAHCTGYNAACPNDKFGTMGANYACSCPPGSQKEYLDPAKAWAICTRPCPAGRFETTGVYRNCSCPQGSKKDYSGIGSSHAECTGQTLTCPSGKFDTTGKYHNCKCPDGKKKDYDEWSLKKYARCK